MLKTDPAADGDPPRLNNEEGGSLATSQHQGDSQSLPPYYGMYNNGGGSNMGSQQQPSQQQQPQQQPQPQMPQGGNESHGMGGDMSLPREMCSSQQPQHHQQQQQMQQHHHQQFQPQQQQHHNSMVYQHQQQQQQQQHQQPVQNGVGMRMVGPVSSTSPIPSPHVSESRAFAKLIQAKPAGSGEASDDSPPLEALQEHYHMSLEQAARALGISLNKLKRACRQYGIPRWPYRQVRSIRSTIQSLENALEKCESDIERASLKDRLESLIKKESLVCKFASCGLTGPLRNMLFSSKPESICDVLIKDIVEQSGRPMGVTSGGAGGHQDQTATAGVKRSRGEGAADAMGHGAMQPAYGPDKQHAWVPASMYRLPMQHSGHMAPPPGMELGMQYFMSADAAPGMTYVDGSQQHHHHPQQQQQQQQQPQSQPQPQPQPQQQQQHPQQQLMLMQSNPGFAVQGGFVPVGYDLYGQAQPQFVNAGMEGLGPGAPPPHQLVPYMQAPHLSGGGAGDAMRVSHYPQWHGGMAAGVGGDTSGMGGMAAMLQQQKQQQQQQQQFMQPRRLHHQQAFTYVPAQPTGMYGQDQRPVQGAEGAPPPQQQQMGKQLHQQAWLQQPNGGGKPQEWGQGYPPPRGTQQPPSVHLGQPQQQREQLSSPMSSSGGASGNGAVGVATTMPRSNNPADGGGGRGGTPAKGVPMATYPAAVTVNNRPPPASGWGYMPGSSATVPVQQRQQQSSDDGRVQTDQPPGWAGRNTWGDGSGSGGGGGMPQTNGSTGPPSRDSEDSMQQQQQHGFQPSVGGSNGGQQQQQAMPWMSPTSPGPVTPCSAEEAELLVAAADAGRRTAAARQSVSPPRSRSGAPNAEGSPMMRAAAGDQSSTDGVSAGTLGPRGMTSSSPGRGTTGGGGRDMFDAERADANYDGDASPGVFVKVKMNVNDREKMAPESSSSPLKRVRVSGPGDAGRGGGGGGGTSNGSSSSGDVMADGEEEDNSSSVDATPPAERRGRKAATKQHESPPGGDCAVSSVKGGGGREKQSHAIRESPRVSPRSR